MAIVPSLARLSMDTEGWLIFAIFGSAAAVAQLFPVHTLKNNAFTPAIVFMLPAVLLLPPELVALMAIVQHVPDWLKRRYPWYIQTFNIANYTLDLVAAWAVAHFVLEPTRRARRRGRGRSPGSRRRSSSSSSTTRCSRRCSASRAACRLRETGLFILREPLDRLVLADCSASASRRFWHSNPWLIPFALAPLLLIHRSLSVPALQAEARVDPKTGLFNARHFAAALHEELAPRRRASSGRCR